MSITYKVLAVAFVAAFCLPLPQAQASLVSPQSWTTQTVNNASASVSASNEIDLRIFKTSYALARANLGVLPGAGTLSVAFDWTIRADGWYEYSFVSIDTVGTNAPVVPLGICAADGGFNCTTSGLVSVANIYPAPFDTNLGCGSTLNCSPTGLVLAYPRDFRDTRLSVPSEQLVHPAYGARSGRASVSQGASGQTYLNFLIAPSWGSEFCDHFNTYFEVSNLQLDYTQIPLPSAAFLLAPALLGLGFMRRRAS